MGRPNLRQQVLLARVLPERNPRSDRVRLDFNRAQPNPRFRRRCDHVDTSAHRGGAVATRFPTVWAGGCKVAAPLASASPGKNDRDGHGLTVRRARRPTLQQRSADAAFPEPSLASAPRSPRLPMPRAPSGASGAMRWDRTAPCRGCPPARRDVRRNWRPVASPYDEGIAFVMTRGEEDAPRVGAAFLRRRKPHAVAAALTRSARQVGVPVADAASHPHQVRPAAWTGC